MKLLEVFAQLADFSKSLVNPNLKFGPNRQNSHANIICLTYVDSLSKILPLWLILHNYLYNMQFDNVLSEKSIFNICFKWFLSYQAIVWLHSKKSHSLLSSQTTKLLFIVGIPLLCTAHRACHLHNFGVGHFRRQINCTPLNQCLQYMSSTVSLTMLTLLTAIIICAGI